MTLLAFALGVILGVLIAVALLRVARRPHDQLLSRFEQEMRQLEAERKGLSEALKERMQALGEETGRVAEQTQSLAVALRRPGVRGQWEEWTLKNVVETCGLAEHCDFDTQKYIAGEDGAARPDLIVKLPGGGVIVVDAKVPLDAYLDAAEAGDGTRAEELLDVHVGKVREKVRELAARAYPRRFERAPEMVVMFVASESGVSAAAQRDPKLLKDAAKSGVMIATPTTMIALLQIVAVGWREERIAEHAEQVGRLSVELCERLNTFAEHLAKSGRGLQGAVDAHNAAVGSFEGRLMPTVRRIAEFDVSEAQSLEAPKRIDQLARQPHEHPAAPPAGAHEPLPAETPDA